MSGEWVEEECSACGGSGRQTCLNCNGTGGSMGNVNPADNWLCDDCNTTGSVKCMYCNGTGYVQVRRTERDDRHNGHR